MIKQYLARRWLSRNAELHEKARRRLSHCEFVIDLENKGRGDMNQCDLTGPAFETLSRMEFAGEATSVHGGNGYVDGTPGTLIYRLNK